MLDLDFLLLQNPARNETVTEAKKNAFKVEKVLHFDLFAMMRENDSSESDAGLECLTTDSSSDNRR